MTFVTAFVYLAGSFVCHQIAERSFHLGGVQLPVCARCTGLYVGAAVGLIAWLAQPQRRLSFARARLLLACAAVPTLVTVFPAWIGAWDPSNVLRAVFAAPLGAGAGVIVAAVLSRNLR